MMRDRVGKQCRERWHNHLNPEIKKFEWTEKEEWILYIAHQLFGNRWADISIYIPGRTDNTIKNHWNSSMRKKLSYFREQLLATSELFKKDKKGFEKHFQGKEREILSELISSGKYKNDPEEQEQFNKMK